jgi:hyaluronate lyase
MWPDLRMSGPDPANITTTYRRILRVAIAWATPGIDEYRDDGVERTLIRWYRHMTGSWYNAAATPVGNWWFWEIGIPRVLGDLTLVLQHRLQQRDVDKAIRAIRRFTPNPNRIEASNSPATGSNRADKVLACLLRGIAARSTDDMKLARRAILDVPGGGANSLLAYRTSGDGFYADGSYIHHLKLPYAGPYGKAALAALAPTVMLLSGTSWELSQRTMRPILDSPALTFAPFIWNGRMMETVRGRTVAREHERDHTVAWGVAEAIMLLAGYVGEPYRSRFRSLAKAWLVRCSEDYRATSISDLRRAEALLKDESVTPAPEKPGHVPFGVQERMVHRGKGWAFTVATSSARIAPRSMAKAANSRSIVRLSAVMMATAPS